jgi:protoporphyrinogen oxidase
VTHVTILGAGFAGLAAAQRCRRHGAAVIVYEKNSYVGGHASSMSVDGFTFDEGPHVSFSKIDPVIAVLAGVPGGYREFSSIVNNWWRGHWVKHPAQVNLHGLPPDLVARVLTDFVHAYFAPETKPDNYGEWLYAQFGKAFSEEFPFRYTRKYWTVEPGAMATDWIGPRVYKPKLEEVLRGAVGPVTDNLHYITHFRYPLTGGFGRYAETLQSDATIRLSQAVEELDPARRRLTFANGATADYGTLISSLPIPELIRRIKDCPSTVRAAADRLVCTSVCLIDVGVARAEGFPEGHWLYYYDEDLCFSRVSYPHLLSPHNVPAGCGSIQAEVYYTKFKGLPAEDMLARGMDDMRKVGLLRADDDVRVARVRKIPYGNVLYDHARAAALAEVNAYLGSIGVIGCGRYGLWNYHWTDEAVVSGWDAADAACGVKRP